MVTTVVSSSSAARRVLQRRALQCSFTSVFHLRQTGLMKADEASKVERLFLISAGLPLLVFVVSGAATVAAGSTTLTLSSATNHTN